MVKTLEEILNDENVNEKFEEAYGKVLKNMQDTATDPKAKRKITLDIIFTQNLERDIVKYEVEIKEKVSSRQVMQKQMFVDNSLPGQMNIQDYDPETGEIVEQ